MTLFLTDPFYVSPTHFFSLNIYLEMKGPVGLVFCILLNQRDRYALHLGMCILLGLSPIKDKNKIVMYQTINSSCAVL